MVAAVSRREFFRRASAGAFARTRPSSKPNILFLLTDDQRWDALGCMGRPVIETPNIDRLAREGVTFENNFCTSAICMTSRASIFTGLHERTHGISSFTRDFTPEQLSATYPQILREAGYRTGFIGKYGVGNNLPAAHFDYFKGFPGQGRYYHERNGKTVHLTQILGEQAAEFLASTSDHQPFCLSVSFKAPHVQDGDPRQFLYDPALEGLYRSDSIPPPKTAEERYFEALPSFLKNSEGRERWKIRFATPEMYQRSVKGYYRLITGVDAVVGSLLKLLETRRLLDNTAVVFTSDNGFFLGEHGLAGKWLMHEESIRTPLIIRDPHLTSSRGGSRVKRPALNVDIAPTLLGLAGLEPPRAMQGRDLAPLLAGKNVAWRRDWYYSHLFQHPKIPRSEGLRNHRWKYIRYLDTEPVYEELYDLESDPLEEHNLALAKQQPAVLAGMRSRLMTWRRRLGEWDPGRRWREPS
ncbi:MAG: sulfatase [Bryobacteraceae bacterium]|nr:sulfatase [Bryobacterales bacterium]MEB2360349.1 sulfatase [Bryobacterales bacterium]NUN01167.1 sulfatase [Bryobacteraceae bacterium]